LGFSISASTRDKRGRIEVDGIDYYFLSPEEFKSKIDNHEFIEWEEVYQGNYYGTLKSEIERLWSEGKHVVFDVDVKGGLNLKEYFGDQALAIFVKVPSMEILMERLGLRDTETENSISQRLFKARFEITFEDKFDQIIINQDLDQSLTEAQKLVDDFINS